MDLSLHAEQYTKHREHNCFIFIPSSDQLWRRAGKVLRHSRLVQIQRELSEVQESARGNKPRMVLLYSVHAKGGGLGFRHRTFAEVPGQSLSSATSTLICKKLCESNGGQINQDHHNQRALCSHMVLASATLGATDNPDAWPAAVTSQCWHWEGIALVAHLSDLLLCIQAGQ